MGDGVVRMDPTNGSVATVVQSGAGSGQGVGKPRLLSVGGPDLLIVDDGGNLWRWRPSDAVGGGTLGADSRRRRPDMGPGRRRHRHFHHQSGRGNVPAVRALSHGLQVLRYEPTADGSGFSAPGPYFLSSNEPVATFKQIMVDGDLYAVTAPDVLKYFSGTKTSYSLDPAPDDKNLRPGHSYALIGATGTKGSGQLFIWDSQWQRILVYNKVDGTYVEQYLAAAGAPPLSDLTGMYIVDRGVTQPPILVWARPTGCTRPRSWKRLHLRRRAPGASGLASLPPPTARRPARSAQWLHVPAADGYADPPPPSGQPTERPRRTPRAGTSPAPSASP